MAAACHMWPAISPHGPELPNSIWNLPLRVWLMLAREIDQNKKD